MAKRMDLNLDIGSGSLTNPHKSEHVFLNNENLIHIDIDKKSYHIEAKATVYYLPFKDQAFNIVYIRHVLEHLEEPFRALLELKRVSTNKVIVQVPNASYYKFKSSSEEHLFSWNSFTLTNLLNRVFKDVSVYTTKRYNKKRNYIKKVVFAIACLFFGDNEITAIANR